MNADGSDVRRLTHEPGYDGGAFFSADGTQIVYRARHPESAEELADYQRLLTQNLIRPSRLDIYVMNADGTNRRRVTNNGAANFAPYMHPDGRRIIFSSNMDDPEGRNFDLYMINADGTGLERITASPDFDGFPMFTPDGRSLVFASNRNQAQPGETNVFIADWIQ
jgi:Tol biopolymer transport system component